MISPVVFSKIDQQFSVTISNNTRQTYNSCSQLLAAANDDDDDDDDDDSAHSH
jgi:hypothetical protein